MKMGEFKQRDNINSPKAIYWRSVFYSADTTARNRVTWREGELEPHNLGMARLVFGYMAKFDKLGDDSYHKKLIDELENASKDYEKAIVRDRVDKLFSMDFSNMAFMSAESDAIEKAFKKSLRKLVKDDYINTFNNGLGYEAPVAKKYNDIMSQYQNIHKFMEFFQQYTNYNRYQAIWDDINNLGYTSVVAVFIKLLGDIETGNYKDLQKTVVDITDIVINPKSDGAPEPATKPTPKPTIATLDDRLPRTFSRPARSGLSKRDMERIQLTISKTKSFTDAFSRLYDSNPQIYML